MFDKLFFKDQQLLLKLANTEAGRFLIGLKEKYPIVKVDPSGFHYLVDRHTCQARFYTYNRMAQLFLPPLEKIKVAEESIKIKNRYEAFLHFSGLETKNYKYPQVFLVTTNYYDNTGEGRVYNSGDLTWAACHDAAEGDGTTTHIIINAQQINPNNWAISRAFHPVDTSGLLDDADITAASFYLYRDDTIVALSNPDATDVDLVQSNQASPTAIAVGDYDGPGTTVTGSQALSATSNGAYFSIVLDATGLTWISKTDHTLLATRIARDTDNSAPTGDNSIACQTRGAANPPYLAVTYTAEEAYAYFM